MALRRQNRLTIGGSNESIDDPVLKLEQGLDALSCEGQTQVCEFYQYVNQNCPDLLPSVQEMIAQVLKDVRHHKAEQERLLMIMTSAKHQHHEQLRKMEDEVEHHIEKVKSEERKQAQTLFKDLMKSKNEELEDLKTSISRLENTLIVASTSKKTDLDDDTAISLQGQVVSLQQENNTVKTEMTQILTQLALMKSELTTLKQEYQVVNRELAKTKIVAVDRSKETEQSARHLSILEQANKKLRDANEDLRSAFEGSRGSHRLSVRESVSSGAGDDEISNAAFRQATDSGSSLGAKFQVQSESAAEETRSAVLKKDSSVARPVAGTEANMTSTDSRMSPAAFTTDENMLLKQQVALYGVSGPQQFLRIEQSEYYDGLESEVETNRRGSLYSLNNYQLLNMHCAQSRPLESLAEHSAATRSRETSRLPDLPQTPQSNSSGMFSGCSLSIVSRTGSASTASESGLTVNSSVSQQSSTPKSHRLRRQLPSTDVESDDGDEDGLAPVDENGEVRMQRRDARRRHKVSAPSAPYFNRSISNSPNPSRKSGSSSRRKDSSKTSTTSKNKSVVEPSRMYKIVLAGDVAVGKTTFLVRLCKGKFVPYCSSTLGVDFHTKVVELDGQAIALQLWDTAGQERFRSIAKSYFRRADGVLLLYDVTYERSFLSIRQWVESILEAAEKRIPILLVGNKVDLRDACEKQGQRCIRYEDGLRCARDNNVIFVECSAKDGTNLQQATVDLARLLRANEDLEVKNLGLSLSNAPAKPTNDSLVPSCCN